MLLSVLFDVDVVVDQVVLQVLVTERGNNIFIAHGYIFVRMNTSYLFEGPTQIFPWIEINEPILLEPLYVKN